jgi:hypothetical protein
LLFVAKPDVPESKVEQFFTAALRF